MAEEKNEVVVKLRQYAEKIAAEKAAAGEGPPDRMSVSDGQGGIEASKCTVPHDVGEDEVKCDQPTDGSNQPAKEIPEGGPDRLTCADGQGGVSASKGEVPTDPGESEVKKDQPTDGETRKAANLSKRAAGIRAALMQANPELGKRLNKEAKSDDAPPVDKVPADDDAGGSSEKKAGEAPSLDLSQSTLAKIASTVLSTDEGIRYVHDTLEKQAGEEAARAQIQEAITASQAFDQSEQVKQAAFDDLGNKVHSIHAALEQNGVTEEHADAIIKQAAMHQEKINQFDHPMLKQAYAQGMDDTALLAAADEAAGEEGVPPVEEAMPMGGEDLSEEEIMLLLEEMLASGQITAEDIEAAVAATAAAEEGGEGAPVAPGGATPEAVPA